MSIFGMTKEWPPINRKMPLPRREQLEQSTREKTAILWVLRRAQCFPSKALKTIASEATKF